ncbi:MAG: magnesium chelatase subunit D, partial [Azospirillaceae bacterium]
MSLAAAPPAPPGLDEPGPDEAATGGVATGSVAAGAAALFAVDPAGLGGIVARGHAGPVRDRWLSAVRRLMPPDRPWRRIPCHVAEDRLLGGLDLAATLSAGRPVASRGLLAECDGGVAVLAMAERLEARAVSAVAAAVDHGEVVLERDGIADRPAARLGVVALDESVEDEARPPSSLMDRLAFHVDLRPVALGDLPDLALDAGDVIAARERLADVAAGEETVEALIATAMALGIASLRAPLLALRAARAAAALAGRDAVEEEDAALAARLVLSPRATRLPPPPEGEEPEAESDPDTAEDDPDDEPGEPHEESPTEGGDREDDDREEGDPDRPLEDVVLEAAQAALPPDLLARLARADAGRGPGGGGRAGSKRTGPRRGRPIGVRRGDPRSGARLDVIETLKAAAPWQRLRRPDGPGPAPEGRRRIEVRRDDFRVKRLKDRAESVTVFAVDASGSAALERLAEAKGAVERLLADSYARRDRVALVAFRGAGAEVLLPPTRSL